MKTVVVEFNNVRHVREVADDVSESDVMRQVVLEKTGPSKAPPEQRIAVTEVKSGAAVIQSIGKGWYRVMLDGKIISPRALRKDDAERMARELNLGTYTAPKPLVIGDPNETRTPAAPPPDDTGTRLDA